MRGTQRELAQGDVSQRSTGLRGQSDSHLCFPHNLTPGTDPRNEDEFLTLRLLVVAVCDTGICEGALSGI
jgi:hypothetical protein